MNEAARRRRERELRDWRDRQSAKARNRSAQEDCADTEPEYDYMIPDEYYATANKRSAGASRNVKVEEYVGVPCPWSWAEVLAGAWKGDVGV